MLHKTNLSPIRYAKVYRKDGKVLSIDDIVNYTIHSKNIPHRLQAKGDLFKKTLEKGPDIKRTLKKLAEFEQ